MIRAVSSPTRGLISVLEAMGRWKSLLLAVKECRRPEALLIGAEGRRESFCRPRDSVPIL